MNRLCNVHYRKFTFADYPSHVRHLKNYAFKPLIIHVSDDVNSVNIKTAVYTRS